MCVKNVIICNFRVKRVYYGMKKMSHELEVSGHQEQFFFLFLLVSMSRTEPKASAACCVSEAVGKPSG